MKQINYNGGMVSFKLPTDWKEEYYDDGEAAFYSDNSDSGTLRLYVEHTELKNKYTESFKLASASGMYVEEGFPLKEEVKLINEDDNNILVYSWEVIVPIDSKGQRIVMFSYALPPSLEGKPEASLELNFIRNTILEANYSTEG